MLKHSLTALALATCATASAQEVSADWVRAHETFLAGDELAGRGSATRDEAIAAAYVATQFQAYGLKPPPGMTGYIQKAPVVRRFVAAPPMLMVGTTPIPGLTLVRSPGGTVTGQAQIVRRASAIRSGAPIIIYTGRADDFPAAVGAAREKGATLIIGPATKKPETPWAVGRAFGVRLADDAAQGTTIAALPAAALTDLATRAQRQPIRFDLPFREERAETSNAIGYLPGTDPAAGVLLLSAHLDHLGIEDGRIMHGANDDASGTVAVLELARTLAAGKPMKRGILFGAFGAEEVGLLGSKYFGVHLPIPVERIAANIEFEMIGAQDPRLPRGALMMTGYERSDLGERLTAHGARLAPDPYPDQNFFRRSDNYSLALRGVVAHTLSGWAVVPTYHQPTDTIAAIDFPFMTQAIASLVDPIRNLANSDAAPEWKPGGRPKAD
ncbi:M28 family peptidase [Sphingomonas sp.]|uniref:M28 family peptidase n=1 Tax=Sphingomonas sp. TaxID=28214 RepID=UPI0035AEDDAB